MTHLIEESVLKRLAEQGWLKDRLISTASKDFETVNVPKTGHVRIRRSREPHFVLQGEYWSEGRNILSTCTVFIPEDANAEAADAATQRFLASVEAKIADSYAVRLLRA